MPTAFRLYSKVETFWGSSGELLDGGYLLFFDASSHATPKDVYGDKSLTVNNGNRVDLDASGRPENDIWGDGSYFVEVYNSDDVKQSEADDVEVPGGAALAIPIPDPGEFLTGDGAQFLVDTVLEVPDPSGHADDWLQTDGTDVFWAAAPDVTVPDPDIVVSADSFQAGVSTDETKFFIQRGSDSAPASGTKVTSKAVVFPTPYSAKPFVSVTNTTGFITAAGNVQPTISVLSITTSGFTVQFSTQTGESNSDNNIITACDFDWRAEGNREVAP